MHDNFAKLDAAQREVDTLLLNSPLASTFSPPLSSTLSQPLTANFPACERQGKSLVDNFAKLDAAQREVDLQLNLPVSSTLSHLCGPPFYSTVETLLPLSIPLLMLVYLSVCLCIYVSLSLPRLVHA